MEVLLTLLYTAFFSYLVYKTKLFHAEGISARTSVLLFNLKVLAGVFLALVYTFYYGDRTSGDIYKYFDDGKVIFNVLFTDPLAYFQIVLGINTDSQHLREILETTWHWYKPFETPLYNDNRTIIRFNALAHIISFGSLGVHTVLMCFLSYIGLLAMYKTFVGYLKGKELELIFVVFLLPSPIFWGSGVLKEGILLFGLGCFLFSWNKLLKFPFKWQMLALLFISLMILSVSKIYVLLALLPPLVAYSWCYLTHQKYVVVKYLSIFFVGFLGTLTLHMIFPEFDLLQMMANKQRDFINVAIEWGAKSLYDIPILEPNIWSLIKGIPLAVLNVITRPHLLEVNNAMMLMAALENFLLMTIMAICILFSKKKIDNWNFMFFCIGFVVILFTLIGLITPILGALVRYKIPALPFLLIIFLLVFDKQKFIAKFPRLNFLNR